MLCVEGIVVRLRPKVVKRVQLSKATQTASERAYSDSTSFDAFPATSVYPTQEDDGNPLEIEYGLSTYQNHQTLTIQEMPEKAPAGQLPRTIEIILDNDLVHLCKPDDRVQVIGNYRCVPGNKGGYTSGAFSANSDPSVAKSQLLRYVLQHSSTSLDYSSTRNPDSEEQQEEETQIYETYDPLFHGKSREITDKIASSQYMRKYIHITQSDIARTQPITARSLETLIGLLTAHDKARLFKHVTCEFALKAKNLT
ncbi:hypothetical protein TKK_0000763 [Trichogramma kaykai]